MRIRCILRELLFNRNHFFSVATIEIPKSSAMTAGSLPTCYQVCIMQRHEVRQVLSAANNSTDDADNQEEHQPMTRAMQRTRWLRAAHDQLPFATY